MLQLDLQGESEEEVRKVYACVAFEEWRDKKAWFDGPSVKG
jgi:hypothetical protein